MPFSEKEQALVLEQVKEQPRTVQEIAHIIDRSWVTTEKYLHELKAKTGLINLRTFREGTQGALKIVYYATNHFSLEDEVKKSLALQILNGRKKEDFDFMDLFQFIPSEKKTSYQSDTLNASAHISQATIMTPAQENAFVFSGNLSYLTYDYKGKSMVQLVEEELEKGAHIRVLCRVNTSSLSNIEKVAALLVKYPNQFEIRHRHQPLRGILVDGKFGRFRNEERAEDYRQGELDKSIRTYYEITSPAWIKWMESVFWNMWRSSIPYDQRIIDIQRIKAN